MLSLVAIDMGYGHLRAAQPLADLLHVPVLELDRPPLANAADVKSWGRARWFHEGLSRASQWPIVGGPFLSLMDAYTHIDELHPERDLSASALASRSLHAMIRRGLGAGLVEHLRATGSTLLTTFYAPALIADAAGLPSFCLVTDADFHRVWVAHEPARSRIHYLAPSQRVVRRLRAYGVAEERITFTGFPLPLELLGGPDLPALRANLLARLRRLDPSGRLLAAHRAELEAGLPPELLMDSSLAPQPPLVVFAIGGAGAQMPLARRLLEALAPALRAGRLRLALVTGLRQALAGRCAAWVEELRVGAAVEVLSGPDWLTYYRRFNALLARADVLWTKPSEMTFYAALGLPLILAPAVGAHERYNARWAQEHGAGLPQLDPSNAAGWLLEWLEDGALAEAAWSAFRRLPSRGTYRIAAALGAGGFGGTPAD